MKYLAGIGKGKTPIFGPSGAGAGTLTFQAPLNSLSGSNILLVVNTSTNDILYNQNNSDFSGVFSGGNGTDLVLTLDVDSSSYAATDDIHAWIDILDGAKGIDFLSELAVKDKTYSAMKNVELNAESITIDNAEQVNQLSLVNLNLQTAIDSLTELLEVPDTFFVNTGQTAEVGIAGPIDLSNKTSIVSIRSMHDDTTISLGTSSGSTTDILSSYALGKDDFIDIKANYITTGGTAGSALITVIE